MRVTALSQDQFTVGSDPVLPMQVATKRYVDNKLTDISKNPIAVPSTGEVDLSATDYFVVNVADNTVITLTPTQLTSLNGRPAFLMFDIQSGESSSVIWNFPNIQYNQGTEVTLTTEGRDIVGLLTRDGGVNWVMISVAANVNSGS